MPPEPALAPPAPALTDFNMEAMTEFQPTASIALHLEVPDGSDWMARGKAGGCRVITPWREMPHGGFGRLVLRNEQTTVLDWAARRSGRATSLR